jgi:hypothetical protein
MMWLDPEDKKRTKTPNDGDHHSQETRPALSANIASLSTRAFDHATGDIGKMSVSAKDVIR